MSGVKQDSVEFSGLVLGFCSAALSYMGYGASNAASRNLELAKQNIQILKVLKEKTKGNLSADEQKLLHDALMDLEEKYKEALKA